MIFLGLNPGEAVPDARMIWNFKQALEQDGRDGARKLFERFEQMLTDRGLIGRGLSWMPVLWMRRASEIAVRKTNKLRREKDRKGLKREAQKGGKKDCDARWAKKNNEMHYGYKNLVKVDAKKKLVTKYETTGANVHDSRLFDKLVDESDEAVLADSAYLSE